MYASDSVSMSPFPISFQAHMIHTYDNIPTSDSRRPSDAMLDLAPKPVMVDSGVMTDPWEPEAPVGAAVIGGAGIAAAGVDLQGSVSQPPCKAGFSKLASKHISLALTERAYLKSSK